MTAPQPRNVRWARRTALCLLACIEFAGCASLAPIEPAERHYSGRFAAIVTRGTERESVSGRFVLALRSGSITVDLASPLGNTLARVEASENQATLTAPQTDGSLATWEGANAEALAESVLGWRLPVSGLADWIAGRPASKRPAKSLPALGAVQRFEQDGWTITVDERFDGSGEPRRLTFDRVATGSAAPAVRLRWVLDRSDGIDDGREATTR